MSNDSASNKNLIAELLEAAKWTVGFCVSEMLKIDAMDLPPHTKASLVDGFERIRKQASDAIIKVEGE